MKNISLFIIMLSSSVAFSSEVDSIQRLSFLRFDVEEQAQKLQQQIKYNREAEDVIFNKINEVKAKITREKLKSLEIENELKTYQIGTQSKKGVSTDSFSIFHSVVLENIESLKKEYPLSKTILESTKELQSFYDRRQLDIYQIVLVQLFEKIIYEMSRINLSFETHRFGDQIKNAEVLRIGGWLAVAKLGNNLWLYSQAKGDWIEIETDDKSEVFSVFEGYKQKHSNFIPSSLVAIKEKYR